jgi:hypothetical protein
MGLTTVYFSVSGNILAASDLLKINSKGLFIPDPHNFIILLDIPSFLDAFLFFSEPIMLNNSTSVTGTIFFLGNPREYESFRYDTAESACVTV